MVGWPLSPQSITTVLDSLSTGVIIPHPHCFQSNLRPWVERDLPGPHSEFRPGTELSGKVPSPHEPRFPNL